MRNQKMLYLSQIQTMPELMHISIRRKINQQIIIDQCLRAGTDILAAQALGLFTEITLTKNRQPSAAAVPKYINFIDEPPLYMSAAALNHITRPLQKENPCLKP